MRKRVILTLMPGSIDQGFPVVLRITTNGSVAEQETQLVGQLPPAPELLKILYRWQSAYRHLTVLHSRIKARPGQVTQEVNISSQQLGLQLVIELNNWLNSGATEWQKLRDQLQYKLHETNEILVLIETDNPQVRQLPWHLWDFFSERYTQSEVVLSMPEYQPLARTNLFPVATVKILAILGNSVGIDVQQDRVLLEQLPGADITFLVEPKRQELTNQLWNQGWDILFFAGHSDSQAHDTSGQLFINRTDSLTISDLRYALKTAIAQGLKLAIFNSCDGLGLARNLAGLHIPQVIVMRESVPDRVAQVFLKHFLVAFASGKSSYLAVREARERLAGLEDQYPYASWLPVIFQNPAEAPLTWQELCSGKHQRLGSSSRRILQTVLLTSLCITSLIMGVRHLGMLQSLELQAFDYLLQRRPDEQPDPRLLVVAVTENDLQLPEQKQRKGSLSDAALNQLLQKLEQYKPRVIGLDIYRDFAVEAGQENLATRLRQSKNLIAVCKARDPSVNDPGVAPPPEISTERLGFSDFIADSDGVLRRQLVSMDSDPASPCTTPYALNIQLAFRYLAAQGISSKFTPDGVLQIGSATIEPLKARTGGYQGIDAWGYQLLLNYRSPRSPEKIADTITLAQVLNSPVVPTDLQDRIILIGTTADSFRDHWETPYSSGSSSAQQLSGVLAQAQMVSQILSTVLDKRPLLWAYPLWNEIIWVFGWSVVGGILAARMRSPLYLVLAVVGGAGCVYGICFGLLLQNGCWVPFVPATLALLGTSISVTTYTRFLSQS